MNLITDNTNTAMPIVFGDWFQNPGMVNREMTRNGWVRAMRDPVTITYLFPRERVNFCPDRDANPFFHLLETVWMLAGRNDVEWISKILPKMADYSDDGVTFNGAYGHRMYLGIENRSFLQEVVAMLKKDPYSRRAYVPLYAMRDVGYLSRDIPCNVGMSFNMRNSKLDMHVFNRSNDAVWGGVCGSNVVHFSYFQEYVAARLSATMGSMHVTSSNLHIYENPQSTKLLERYAYLTTSPNTYNTEAFPYRLTPHSTMTLEADCRKYVEEGDPGMNDWLNEVVHPMHNCNVRWRNGEKERAIERLQVEMPNCDWRIAATNWMERRINK